MSNLPRIVAFLAVILVGVPTVGRFISGGAAAEGRPSTESMEDIRSRTEEIARAREATSERHGYNRMLLSRLASGTLSLPEVVDTHWAANHASPGFIETIPEYEGVSSIEGRQRLNVLRLVRVYLTGDPNRAKIMARLVAEYETAYGKFPLRSIDDLPGDSPSAIR